MDEDPLVVTLTLDARSMARLEALRRAHFPAALNRVPAHVSMFHALPGWEAERVLRDVRARAVAAFPVMVTGVMSLGRGTALRLASQEGARLRADLAAHWAAWLTPQDRGKWAPHVTVQNKVTAEAARALQATLARDFVPWEARAEAVALWRYRGGPWEALASVTLP
jgi:hypothetical protein